MRVKEEEKMKMKMLLEDHSLVVWA
ncbi:unnamed protein product, partial [Onchocerca ochengi]|uniref:Uncharacterized protein n=1 Tax=Onchocerca ochengi TaxID=42157 RepID=A0A182EZ08_ONCOC